MASAIGCSENQGAGGDFGQAARSTDGAVSSESQTTGYIHRHSAEIRDWGAEDETITGQADGAAADDNRLEDRIGSTEVFEQQDVVGHIDVAVALDVRASDGQSAASNVD